MKSKVKFDDDQTPNVKGIWKVLIKRKDDKKSFIFNEEVDSTVFVVQKQNIQGGNTSNVKHQCFSSIINREEWL
ncbi:hypothetical protein CR513_08554, partial [Mucuna pruriens]